MLRNQHLEVNQRKNVHLSSFIFIILKFFIKSNQENISLPFYQYFFPPPPPPAKKHTNIMYHPFFFPTCCFFCVFSHHPPKKKRKHVDPKKKKTTKPGGDNRQVPHRSSTSPTLRWSFGASPGGGHRRGGAWGTVLGAVDLWGGHGFTNGGGRFGRWEVVWYMFSEK